MKKIIAGALSVMILTSVASAESNSILVIKDNDYLSQLSEMIQKNENDNYIGSLNLTIGSDTMMLDGTEIKIDNEGSTPIIENDTTLLPIRGVAEAIGADVEYTKSTNIVSLFNDDTEVNMQLGSTEIEINGKTQQMPVAAKVVNDRTLIPLRAATEALGCDVSWDGENQKIILTRPYQTKRIIVKSENADTTNATAVAKGDDITVLQYDTEENARNGVSINESKGFTAEPDYVYVSDSLSWGTDRIKAPSYCNSYSGKQTDLTVAVIDSGLDSSNSCFRNKVVSGYDFYRGDSDPDDENGHGTHVASTVADVTSGFSKIKIMPLKTADSSGSSYSTLINAAAKYATDNGAKVINLSMGGYHDNSFLREGIEYAISHGVTVVAAAGNDNTDISKNFFSPACIQGVVAVAALADNNQKAYFSNYGNGIIDIAAPGVKIGGAARGGGTVAKNGTSMASPHIAGTLALIRSANPNYSSADAINAMKSSANNLGNSAYYGAGIPNLENLVSKIPVENSVTVNTLDARKVSQTNATVYGSISYSGTRPSEVGIYFGTSSNNLSKVASDKINHNKNPFDMWYDLNSEAGQYLSSGTTYYYQCYAIQNGKEVRGSINSFTTKSENSSLSVSTGGADSITSSNATVRGSASYSGAKPSEVGLYFGTSADNMIKVASDTINHNKNPFDIWYDLNSEAGQYLTAGTTYYYKIYGVQNGNEISGDVKSFTTANDSAERTYTAYVFNTDGSLAINSRPSKGYQIGAIPEGARCTVYPDRMSGNWCWVEYNGISGYSYKDYLTQNLNVRTGIVRGTDGTLVINSRPSVGYQIGLIPEGANCTVYPDKTSGNWYWVSYNGVSGYSYKNYIILQ